MFLGIKELETRIKAMLHVKKYQNWKRICFYYYE